MSDRVSQQLGNYRLISLLGKGGFAEVYLGEHIHLSTEAAIKVHDTQLTSEDGDEFRTEARTIARLIHPHIVRVLEFGIEDKTPFLVMDYAPYGTLRQHHPKGTRLDLPTVVSYVRQVAAALQFAHDQNLIHRDVKPENILLGRHQEVLLSDFGIALVAQSSRFQSEQKMAGTIAYMAPEQIQGKPRPASDQYSLGIVVYEWISGDRPFHGSMTELVGQHLSALPPPLQKKVPTISPAVEQVVLKALAKDPKQRFASVQAFATALEEACLHHDSNLPIPPPFEKVASAKPPSLPGPSDSFQSQTWFKHKLSRRTLMGMVIGTAIVVGGGFVALDIVNNEHPPTIATSPLGTTLRIYRGHSLAVYRVVWSPDGKYLASGGKDMTVQVWNSTNGNTLFTYRGHHNEVWAVAWSTDGRRIASGGIDTTVQVWNATDGSNVLTYHGHLGSVEGVAWSLDGKRIASASRDHTVQVWNAADRSNVYTYRNHTSDVYAVAWSPDGKLLASASADNTVQVWDAITGNPVYIYRGHSAGVRSVAWSHDGQRLASGSQDNTARVWNATNGSNEVIYRGHSHTVNGLAWLQDDKILASGSEDTTVQLWNPTDGSKVYTYHGHHGSVVAVVWSPVNNRIASASEDSTVQVWSAG